MNRGGFVTLWVLVQVLLNLLFLTGIGAAWVRLKRPASEDPRLSRGLQLLQSKIAILEDLSDRTDLQVKQLNALLESKCVDIQNKIIESEKMIRLIDNSRQKSLETAKMFEDKIPHQQIVERQNTVKYVKAARLAHQGVPIAEILKQVDLSQAEVEFIAKVNKDHLMFSEASLPDWVQDQIEFSPSKDAIPASVSASMSETLTKSDGAPKSEQMMRRLGEEFQKAVNIAEQTKSLGRPGGEYQIPQQTFMEIKIESEQPPTPPIETGITPRGKTVQVTPFEFRRIPSDKF
jgi:hypothetical protein